MKIQEASKKIGQHPCNTMILLAGMADTFESVYPEVDNSLVELLKGKIHLPAQTPTNEPPPAAVALPSESRDVLKFLQIKGHWHPNSIPEDKLKSSLPSKLKSLENALQPLLRRALIQRKDSHVSLSVSEKAQINIILQSGK